MKTWAYLFGYHGNRYNCYQIWDRQVCLVYIKWKKRAFISSFFVFFKEVCFEKKHTVFCFKNTITKWMILKQKGDERTRACGSRRDGLSFEKFFLYSYFTRIVYILCLWWYPFGLVFFLKLTLTFLISIGQFPFQSHTETEKYKRKLNHLFLFFSFFPFLHTVLGEYAQHYNVTFFSFFFTL